MTGAALTGAANYLIYSRGPGAGWALFFLLLAAGIFLNRRHSGTMRRVELGLGALLAVSAVQMIIRPSLSNAIVLFTITLIPSAQFLQEADDESPAARKLGEALRKLLLSPMRWLQASQLVTMDGIGHAPEIATRLPSWRNLARAFQIVVPAAALIPPFAILLGTSGCIHVKIDPIEVRAVVDVNVKVDRALDDFFRDLDQQSTTIVPDATS